MIFTDRDYQVAAVDATMAAFHQHKSALGVAATGLGKTHIFARIVGRRLCLGRALVLAHREELVAQAATRIEAVTGVDVDIEMADHRADVWFRRAPVIVASKDSLRGDRLKRFRPGEFATLVTDEAHHAPAWSYGTIYQHFGVNPELRHFGVTATPDRTDEIALGKVYATVPFEYDILFGIKEGWLVPIFQRSVKVDDLDFSLVRTTAGDLNGADLAKIMEQERIVHEVAHPTIELAGDRKTLIFAVNVQHAELLCHVLNRHRHGCARWVSGKTDRAIRKQALADYAAGVFQFLVNVGVFTEGFDEPGIQLIVMARPTESRSLYAQMAGRGTRPLAGVVDGLDRSDRRRTAISQSLKPSLELLDFVGNSGKHKLVCAADILGGNYDDVIVQQTAQAVQAKGKPVNVLDELEAMERAHVEARELAKRRSIVGSTTFTTATVDPFDPFDVFEIAEWRERAWHRGRTATDPQIAWLDRAGVPDAKSKTFTQAKQLIDELLRRQREGKVGFREAQKLAALGYHTDLTLGEAMNVLRKHRKAA